MTWLNYFRKMVPSTVSLTGSWSMATTLRTTGIIVVIKVENNKQTKHIMYIFELF